MLILLAHPTGFEPGAAFGGQPTPGWAFSQFQLLTVCLPPVAPTTARINFATYLIEFIGERVGDRTRDLLIKITIFANKISTYSDKTAIDPTLKAQDFLDLSE
jgi:hypothetical protein